MYKRISVNDLEIGMYVSDLPAESKLSELETKGFIKRRSTIYKIKQSGTQHVIINPIKGKDSPFAFPLRAELQRQGPPTDAQKTNAGKIYRESLKQINKIMGNAKIGQRVDIDPIENIADDICKSITKNPFTLLCLTQAHDHSSHLFEHAINCGILMGVFCQHLGFLPEEIQDKVSAALLHDIGVSKLPEHLLKKQDTELSKDEIIQKQSHVIFGQQILIESQNKNIALVEMCGLHHEHIDGNGYPLRIQREDITLNGRLMAIVDTYETLTSGQNPDGEFTPCVAMEKIKGLADTQLDASLVQEFIHCFGIYPTGTLVELSNNRLAVVITPNANKPERPFVKIIYNLKQSCYEPVSEVDLGASKKDICIVQSVHPRKYNINISNFL